MKGLYAELLLVVVLFGCGFGAAWGWQGHKLQIQALQSQSVQQSEAVLYAKAVDLEKQKTIDAGAEFLKRGNLLRANGVVLRDELDRLRASIARYPDSCTEVGTGVIRANPFKKLFDECAGDIEALAGKTDRHVNDLQFCLAR